MDVASIEADVRAGRLPVLIPGTGLGPAKLGCLMQFVAHLSDGSFVENPDCTNHTLSSIAVWVNDHVTDSIRPGLARFVPDLLTAGLRTNRVNDGLINWVMRQTEKHAQEFMAPAYVQRRVGIYDSHHVTYLAGAIAEYSRLAAESGHEHKPAVIDPQVWAAAVAAVSP
jgi:hypothetical protein